MARKTTRHGIGLLTLTLLAFLVGNAETALAQAKKSDSVVKMDARADRADAQGKQTITITLDIDKPWHIYANPVANEDLANVQTVVTIASKNKLASIKVSYPDGKLQNDQGVKYKTFEGKVTIKAEVQRAQGDNSPLEVSVKLQACNDKTCLFPATIKRALP